MGEANKYADYAYENNLCRRLNELKKDLNDYSNTKQEFFETLSLLH